MHTQGSQTAHNVSWQSNIEMHCSLSVPSKDCPRAPHACAKTSTWLVPNVLETAVCLTPVSLVEREDLPNHIRGFFATDQQATEITDNPLAHQPTFSFEQPKPTPEKSNASAETAANPKAGNAMSSPAQRTHTSRGSLTGPSNTTTVNWQHMEEIKEFHSGP